MVSWSRIALTQGPKAHAHSYYDIPVFDAAGARVVGWCPHESGRHPAPDDAAEVGMAEINCPGVWHPLGLSRAWSWQQGPMAQWVGQGQCVIWNDREDGQIVARLHDVGTGITRTLPGQVYAVTPDGATALSLDMVRLDVLRPGYGYPGGNRPGQRCPDESGVCVMDLKTGGRRLVLSLARAAGLLNAHKGWWDRWGRHKVHYWFNHAKISPGGRRFTVKLRWRRIDGPWTEQQGVSLTCNLDGSDLRLLASATSHVIWLTDEILYYWRQGGLRMVKDAAPTGLDLEGLAEGLVVDNVHARHLDPEGHRFVFDTPYRENVDLIVWNRLTGHAETIATFGGHVPARGPFRCDLHPNPSPDGRRLAVTTLEGGARQIHILQHEG